MANRFGVSALSKSRYVEAYNEEILVDKNTGEFLVKTPEGELASYSMNSRTASAYCDVKKIMTNYNFYGDLIGPENFNIVLPKAFNTALKADGTVPYNSIYMTGLGDPEDTENPGTSPKITIDFGPDGVENALLYLNYDFIKRTGDEKNAIPSLLTAYDDDNLIIKAKCHIHFKNTAYSTEKFPMFIRGHVCDIGNTFKTTTVTFIQNGVERTADYRNSFPSKTGNITKIELWGLTVAPDVLEPDKRPNYIVLNQVGAIVKA